MKIRYIASIVLIMTAILVAGCTGSQVTNNPTTSPISSSNGNSNSIVTAVPSSGYSFNGQWDTADMSAYYSIRNDGTWSYGDFNNDGSLDEITTGTYTVNGMTAHCIDNSDPNNPFDLVINDTGYLLEHEGYPGTEAYNKIIAYTKVNNGPLARPTITPTPKPSYHFSGSGTQTTDTFHLNKGRAVFKTQHDESADGGNIMFSAGLYKADGTIVDIAAMDTDTNQHSKSITIEESGDYYLNVNAADNWNIDVSQ